MTAQANRFARVGRAAILGAFAASACAVTQIPTGSREGSPPGALTTTPAVSDALKPEGVEGVWAGSCRCLGEAVALRMTMRFSHVVDNRCKAAPCASVADGPDTLVFDGRVESSPLEKTSRLVPEAFDVSASFAGRKGAVLPTGASSGQVRGFSGGVSRDGLTFSGEVAGDDCGEFSLHKQGR